MSKIIVAIDFSECSINAFLHALSLARHCSSDLILVWVEKPSSEKDKFEKISGDPTVEVKNQFESLINKYQSELAEKELYPILAGYGYDARTQRPHHGWCLGPRECQVNRFLSQESL